MRLGYECVEPSGLAVLEQLLYMWSSTMSVVDKFHILKLTVTCKHTTPTHVTHMRHDAYMYS